MIRSNLTVKSLETYSSIDNVTPDLYKDVMEAIKFPNYGIEIWKSPMNTDFGLQSKEDRTHQQHKQLYEAIRDKCPFNFKDITPRTREKSGSCHGVIEMDGYTTARIILPASGDVDVSLMEGATCGLAEALIAVAKANPYRYLRRRFVAHRPVVLG